MKRYLVLLPLLAAVSIGTLLAGHKWLDSAQDKIVITEHVLSGDPHAADVTITYRVEDMGQHLFWNTAFSPGHAGESETDFTLSLVRRQSNTRAWWRNNYVSLYTFNDIGYVSNGGAGLLENEEQDYPDIPFRAVRAVADRTPNGEDRTETVRLADYYEYYPLILDANNVNEGYMFDSISTLEVPKFGGYFRLKVPEEKQLVITVRKDIDGNLVYLNVEQAELDIDDRLNTRGVVTDSGIYLIAASLTDGVPDGRLQCPDGPGVHFIPATKNRETEEGFYCWWNVAQVRLFYPTGDALTVDLSLSRDQTKLLLYTVEAEKLVLTVLDAETGDALQRLALMEFEEDGGLTCLEQDDLVFIQQGNAFCLLQETDGQYETVLTGTPSEDLALYYCYYPECARVVWDGQRMVLAAAAEHCSYYNQMEHQLTLGVWDAAGLQFLGAYDYSISCDPYSRRNLMGYSSAPDPLGIAFSGPTQE